MVWLNLKNDTLGAEWILCHTVTAYQSFFNSLTNEKGVSNKKIVTMHSSIIIFAFHSLQRLSVLSLQMFRTFLSSLLLLNGEMFLTFELPKRTFSCCDGCRIYQQKFADRGNWQFHLLIMLCWGNYWNFFILSTMSSSSICFKKS